MKKRLGLYISLFLLAGCSTNDKPEEEPVIKTKEHVADIRVSFAAVGDNLIHNTVYMDPFKKDGDTWNYNGIYEPIQPYIEQVDIANINQETPLGGRSLGLSNYPMFNGPQEIGDAIAHAGFDWVSQASNHAVDAGVQGIMNQMDFWDKYQDSITTTGMNRTQAEANTPRIMDVKGMKIGLLNYTYGLNGLSLPEGQEYMVNMIDEANIKADIASLQGKCDVIVASMHWGQEYNHTENEEQRALAQLLADEGVRVIIGAHPHVIQPMEFIQAKNGEQTLVMYSLGNFVSSQNMNVAMLGGMGKWELIKNGESGKISIENVAFYPTVTHYNKNMQDFKTYALKDYTDELAQLHYCSPDVSRAYFIQVTNDVVKASDDIKVVY